MSQRSASLSLPARRLPRSTALENAESKVSASSIDASVPARAGRGDLPARDASPSTIAARLQRKQMGIMPAERHELLVAALLNDTALIEHRNPVGHAHGRKTVRYQNRNALARQRAKVLKDLRLGARIHGGG